MSINWLTWLALLSFGVALYYSRSWHAQAEAIAETTRGFYDSRRVQCLQSNGVDYLPRLNRSKTLLWVGCFIAAMGVLVASLYEQDAALASYGFLVTLVLALMFFGISAYWRKQAYDVYVSHLRQLKLISERSQSRRFYRRGSAR